MLSNILIEFPHIMLDVVPNLVAEGQEPLWSIFVQSLRDLTYVLLTLSRCLINTGMECHNLIHSGDLSRINTSTYKQSSF